MNYEMEELIPIVAKLANRYNAGESTSMPYEKAEQLMEAVLYCIREGEKCQRNGIVSGEGISAQQAYDAGLMRVEEKVKKALELYNELLPEFVYYGNRCLYDTFAKGIPEFFKWYDIYFEPQNAILTLDYPVLKDLSGYTGIDKIYEFIRCIGLEQKFLKRFSEENVIGILTQYDKHYKDMVDNLSEIVLASVFERILEQKSFTDSPLNEVDYLRTLLRESYGDCKELQEYLAHAIDNIVARRNAAL